MAMGGYGTTAVTALTAQNTRGVHAVHAVPRAMLEAQIDAVLDDIGADVIKTGMLPDAAAVEAVAEKVCMAATERVREGEEGGQGAVQWMEGKCSGWGGSAVHGGGKCSGWRGSAVHGGEVQRL
eukprot:32637-Chlamydomonas_euryale.AAC.1